MLSSERLQGMANKVIHILSAHFLFLLIRTAAASDSKPWLTCDITASHCKAETFEFAATQLEKPSFGHLLLGSWQYFTMHARVSSADAGWPAKPGHWQSGYTPISLHISSHTGPYVTTFACKSARMPKSPLLHFVA